MFIKKLFAHSISKKRFTQTLASVHQMIPTNNRASSSLREELWSSLRDIGTNSKSYIVVSFFFFF